MLPVLPGLTRSILVRRARLLGSIDSKPYHSFNLAFLKIIEPATAKHPTKSVKLSEEENFLDALIGTIQFLIVIFLNH